MTTIKIPEGFIIEELPKSNTYVLPDNAAKFTFVVDQLDRNLRLSSRISINKTYFLAEEYQGLKEFYDAIIQKHSEQLVLKKK